MHGLAVMQTISISTIIKNIDKIMIEIFLPFTYIQAAIRYLQCAVFCLNS